jgi:hypothetical protein
MAGPFASPKLFKVDVSEPDQFAFNAAKDRNRAAQAHGKRTLFLPLKPRSGEVKAILKILSTNIAGQASRGGRYLDRQANITDQRF